MEQNINELTINGVTYVQKGSQQSIVSNKEGLKYVIVRSYGAGVFAGYLKQKDTKGDKTDVVILESKRIYYWSGAASLSQLAVDGTSQPKNCKIPVAIPEHEVMNVIEIIPVSEKAKKSIEECPVWKA